MLESCWGGQKIQTFSSAAANAACAAPSPTPPKLDLGQKWAGMITPLLKLPIRGVIWYQGEANANNVVSGNLYYCQMSTMIADWRHRWALADKVDNGAVAARDPDFPFIIAALAPSGDQSGGAVRYSQFGSSAATFFGTTTTAAGTRTRSNGGDIPILTNVGIANLIDLYDAGSPCGSVHIRNKTAVGERLAAAALALSYGRAANTTWNGAAPSSITMSSTAQLMSTESTTTLTITLVESTQKPATGLAFVNLTWNHQTAPGAMQGYEVQNAAGAWVEAPAAVAVDGASVVVTSAFSPVVAVRFLWQDIPTSMQLYSDGGGQGVLPAMPFWANCTATTGKCALVPFGELPTGPAPAPGPKPGPAPPAPPAPPSMQCVFKNNTEVARGTKIGMLRVTFLDQDACCGACRAFVSKQTGEKCGVAVMMGSGTTKGKPSEWTSECNLYAAKATEKPNSCEWPCARVAMTPM